jgi:HEPN domain-containing protein
LIPDFIIVWIIVGILALVLMHVDPEKRQSPGASPSRRITRGTSRLDPHNQFSNRSILFLPGGYYLTGNTRWETQIGNVHWQVENSPGLRRLRDQGRRPLDVPNLPWSFSRRDRNVKSLCMNWRRAIVGLLGLAERNLQSGREKLILEDYESVISSAAISVENAARALIYCYGGKPNVRSGQEEPLRMLATRFTESEREEFDKAVETVAQITRNRIVLKNLPPGETRQEVFGKRQAKQLHNSALEVTSFFKKIIEEKFGDEIPEVRTAEKRSHSQRPGPLSLG